MTIDRLSVEGRAARHAALADPARLRMVDLLVLGDWSPSELQAVLEIRSNLLAHHLHVLEQQGMIIRTRSEGDRRRSYIRLHPDAMTDLVPCSAGTAKRILFVCTGNSARSPLAAALWRHASSIPAASAGTQPASAVAPGANTTAERHGLSVRDHTPCAVTEVRHDDDFVITVCDRAHEQLSGDLHWSIPNPTPVGTPGAFETAYSEIARRVERLAPQLTAA